MLNQGPEFDSISETIPMTKSDYQWIISNYEQIADSIIKTYFYTFSVNSHDIYPPNYSRSAWIQNQNNSYYEQLTHFHKLKHILTQNQKCELLESCDNYISQIKMRVIPNFDPYIRFYI